MAKYNKKEIVTTITPLINIGEVSSERESFKLSWTVLANIREYVAYVKDVTGKETSPDEVVDKGLQRLFDADRGFRQWLQKKSGNKNRGKHGKAEKAERQSFDTKVEAASTVLPKL
jgi:hypothetical protein